MGEEDKKRVHPFQGSPNNPTTSCNRALLALTACSLCTFSFSLSSVSFTSLCKAPSIPPPNFQALGTAVGGREHIYLHGGFLPTGSSSLADGSTPDLLLFLSFSLFFFFLSDAKHDLQAWVIIYHYSFSVTSALKVNRNASMLTDLLSKIFVPRFRSDDWCLSKLQVYALWKASWLDLEPLALALYITLVEWPSETQDTLDVFNTCFLLPYCWHCIHSSWTYVM